MNSNEELSSEQMRHVYMLRFAIRGFTMSGKLLIVDDKKINRFMLNGIFEGLYEVLEVEQGRQAIEIIEQETENIAAILLDLVMPQVDGFAVLEYMKQEGLLTRIPVILVTVNDADDVINKAYEYEIADYIQKPFQPDIIKRKVSKVIASYQQKNSNI